MNKDYRGYVTQAGLNYESSAHALGQPVIIAKIGIGNGILADNQSPIALTTMVNKLAEFPAKVYVDDKNPGVFVAECAIPADHAINGSGYTINEMSAILDNGIMYSYRRVSGDFKPLITSGEAKSYLYRLRFVPQNASSVNVTIDPTAVWATQDDLSRSIREHDASSDSHKQYAPKASPVFTGTPVAPTPTKTDNTTKLATTAFVKTVAADYAPVNSPALTGKPTTPTPAASANDTSIANAAFVKSAIAALVGSSPEALDTLNELAAALGNDPNFSTTMINALAGKLAKDQNGADIPDKERFLQNLQLKDAAKRSVGTGAGQIPDMSAFSSDVIGNNGYFMMPGGVIEQFMRVVIPANTESINFAPVFKFPKGIKNAIATHNGGAAYYAVVSSTDNGVVNLYIKPNTSPSSASFFVKLTGN